MLINGIEYSEPEIIAKFKLLSDEIVRLNEILKRYEAENLRAKELLGIAVEDMNEKSCNIPCKTCVYSSEEFSSCYGHSRWRYTDEALKLIGGE